MALKHLNVILFLQFLVILSVANFHQAQILYSSTAKLPASWTNNPRAFEHGDQIILSSQKPNSSYGIGFGCGFYKDQEKEDSFYFAIGIVELLLTESGKQVWYFKNTTWLANRNRPVGEDAILQLKEDGNLELRDFDGSLVWSTNTSNKADIVGMKMINTGNLVLYDKYNRTIWQSFDHPTDTLMIGQQLVEGQKLVGSASKSDNSEGNYYLSLTSQGLFVYYQSDDDVLIPFRYFTDIENISSVVLTYSTSALINLTMHFRALPKPYVFFSSPTDYSMMSYIKFDPDGHLKIYGDNAESYDIARDILNNCYHTSSYSGDDRICKGSSDVQNECDYPTSCGDYGVCSVSQVLRKEDRTGLLSSTCSCLPGFVENQVSNTHGKLGCSQLQIYQSTCKSPSSSSVSLLTTEDTYYVAYGSKNMRTDLESCKKACLINCSCTVVLFQQNFGNDSSEGDCIFPNPALSLARYELYGNSSVFVRESNDVEAGSKDIIVAGITVGVIVALILIVCFSWLLFFKKKRDLNDGIEDDLERLPGMPTRFTYEELKRTTEDFQKKLGGGGFGSVYEGSMALGEKIAVKRLDSLGQGKKEFLAEVKIIGSIHHNNLEKKLEEEDEALIKSIFERRPKEVVRRISDEDVDEDDDDDFSPLLSDPKRRKVSDELLSKPTDSLTKADISESSNNKESTGTQNDGKPIIRAPIVKIAVIKKPVLTTESKKPAILEVDKQVEQESSSMSTGLLSLCQNYDSDDE